jgi:hypothetical protein
VLKLIECLFCILQYFSEANDIENWMKDKARLLSSADYGKDQDAADKMLTKHKVRIFSSLKVLLFSSPG